MAVKATHAISLTPANTRVMSRTRYPSRGSGVFAALEYRRKPLFKNVEVRTAETGRMHLEMADIVNTDINAAGAKVVVC